MSVHLSERIASEYDGKIIYRRIADPKFIPARSVLERTLNGRAALRETVDAILYFEYFWGNRGSTFFVEHCMKWWAV